MSKPAILTEHVRDLDLGQIAAPELACVLDDLAEQKAALTLVEDKIRAALDLKYGARAHKRRWCGARDQGDVWFAKKPRVNNLHPTMKPVELVERALRNGHGKNSTRSAARARR